MTMLYLALDSSNQQVKEIFTPKNCWLFFTSSPPDGGGETPWDLRGFDAIEKQAYLAGVW